MERDLRGELQAALGDAYTLERELGGGGMSRVFVARDRGLDRLVVIKVLLPELAAGVNVDRFRREIQLAARLQHPHIVPLLAAGEAAGLPYFTMPFVEGESLAALLARTGELPVRDAVRLLRDVATALAYAHAQGVVHRDIKPDNVLISGGSAVVTDFGVAKALSQSATANGGPQLTGLGITIGTPAYMAPEQAAADPMIDPRSDLYSYGAMAYEALSGQPPFTGRSTAALLAAQVAERPEPVARRRESLPPALAALVMQCLEKRPADRPQLANEIVAALDAIPTSATTAGIAPALSPTGETALARRSRWFRFIPAAVGLAGAALLALRIFYWHGTPRDPHATGTTMLVVLPFKNEGAASDQYFADGLTEAISNRLAGVHGLAVIDPRSADQYRGTHATIKEIGRELSVQYALEGTVRWATDADGQRKVEISPTLVRTDDATTRLVPGPYVVVPADLFQVQTDVATKVAQALDVALTNSDSAALAERPTGNPDAYDAYMRGRSDDKRLEESGQLSPPVLVDAMAQYERAIQLDPKFALAWSKLAEDRMVWALLDQADTARVTAITAAMDTAVRIDPKLPEAHKARADYLSRFLNDDADAYDEYVRAQAGRPNDAELLADLGKAQLDHGRVDVGLATLAKAVHLDPRSEDVLEAAGDAAFKYRRYTDAEAYADRLIALAPTVWAGYGMKIDIAALGFGDTATARQLMDAARQTHFPELTLRVLWTAQNLGPSYRREIEALTLAQLRPEQLFDTVNYYGVKMSCYNDDHETAAARAYADSALRFLDRHHLTGPFEESVHMFRAAAYGVRRDRGPALRDVAAVEQYAARLDNPNGEQAGSIAEGLAFVHLMLGDTTEAITELQRVLTLPTGESAAFLRVVPDLEPLHGNAAFQRMLAAAH